MGGRLEHVAHLADQAAGGGAHRPPQQVADPVVGLLVQLAAGGEELAPLEGDGLLARGGQVEKHERAPVRPARARHRARPGLTGALVVADVDEETLAALEPLEPAGREVQVELTAESVDLAEDAAGPSSHCACSVARTLTLRQSTISTMARLPSRTAEALTMVRSALRDAALLADDLADVVLRH